LTLNQLGYTELTSFDFLETPATETFLRGFETLQQINAISVPDGAITRTGEIISRFPLEPRLAAVLLKAKELGVGEQCLNIVSLLTAGNWKLRPVDARQQAELVQKKFAGDWNSDLMAMHHVVSEFVSATNQRQFCTDNFVSFKVLAQSLLIRTQLKQVLFSVKLPVANAHHLASLSLFHRLSVAFLSGFFQNIAHLQSNGTYAVLANSSSLVLVHPSSCVKNKPDFLMYTECVLTGRDYIRNVSQVDIAWLLDMFPQMFKSSSLALMTPYSRSIIESLMRKDASVD
jgi:pre-mRNA-splicing factor ATP-dependent RNA helicase DHX15/PRP43